jgi:hypothetical protein
MQYVEVLHFLCLCATDLDITKVYQLCVLLEIAFCRSWRNE